MAKNDGGPAFPRLDALIDNSGSRTIRYDARYEARGMSLRDYFAGQALVALRGHPAAMGARGIPWLVEHCYAVADAMLKARET